MYLFVRFVFHKVIIRLIVNIWKCTFFRTFDSFFKPGEMNFKVWCDILEISKIFSEVNIGCVQIVYRTFLIKKMSWLEDGNSIRVLEDVLVGTLVGYNMARSCTPYTKFMKCIICKSCSPYWNILSVNFF